MDGGLLGSMEDLFEGKTEELCFNTMPDFKSNPIAENEKSFPLPNWEFLVKY